MESSPIDNVDPSSTPAEEAEAEVKPTHRRVGVYVRWLWGEVARVHPRKNTNYEGKRYVKVVVGVDVVSVVLVGLGLFGLISSPSSVGANLLGSYVLICLWVSWVVYLSVTAGAVRRTGLMGATKAQQLRVTGSSEKSFLTLIGCVAFILVIYLLGPRFGFSDDEGHAVVQGFGMSSVLGALLIVEFFRSIADTRLQCRLLKEELTEEKGRD